MEKLVTLVNTNQTKPAIAPLAFDYLHEPLVRAGFRVELLDLCFSEDYAAAIAGYCGRARTDFWGVTLRNTDDGYFASQHPFLPLLRDMVRHIRVHSAAPIIMGGVGFSIMPEQILRYCDADFGLICEGEVSFPLLLTRLAHGLRYDDISGLVYRVGGNIKRNDVVFGDLFDAAHSRALIDNKRYFIAGGQAGIETKRGCSRCCIYCVEPVVKGRKVRLRHPSRIVDEIEHLVGQGANVFHINDSEFNLDVGHAIAFCEEIRRRQLQERIQWYVYGMPTPFPDHLVANMCASGCKGMNFGVDSASRRMLRILRRTFQPEHIARAAETCRAHHLPYIMDILLGAPGETGETVRETIEFLKGIEAERVSVTAGLRIYPGTELERMVRDEGISADNPNLYGVVEGNEDLMRPIFYLSAQIAPDPLAFIAELIGDDKRFFGINSRKYNYNTNELLIDAIARGERGAYWAILAGIVEQGQAALEANLTIPAAIRIRGA